MKDLSQFEIRSEIEIHHDSPWFSGHFPDNPILPGIAQLSIVLDTIQHMKKKRVNIREFKRVKFKKIIKPNDTLEIKASQDQKDPAAYSFVITVKGEIACNGIMILKD